MDHAVRIRPGTAADHPAILDLSDRFGDCALPWWRTSEQVARGTRAYLESALVETSVAANITVAEAPDGTILGFVLVQERTDFFDGTAYGHVSDVAVRVEAESQGVATALMEAATEWSRGRGHTHMALNVFAGNERARRFYEGLGYAPETLCYRRILR